MNSKKILVIDDSKVTRDFHAQLIKSAGFLCSTAVDGMDGLEKIMREQFDVILTDINMQGMDGYDFIRRAREIPEYGGTPIIIISTESNAQDKKKGFELGANFYLVKPIDSLIVESLKMVLGEAKRK